jgi:hypothetical protein
MHEHCCLVPRRAVGHPHYGVSNSNRLRAVSFIFQSLLLRPEQPDGKAALGKPARTSNIIGRTHIL